MRISFDIGGTFTDIVLLDENSGKTWLGKSLTTYKNFANAIESGIRSVLQAANIRPSDVDHSVVGATTLVTNALLERKGAKTALLCTKGFADTIEIGRELRYDLYDTQLKMPEPLVGEDLRFEVPERLNARGQELTAVDEDAVVRISDTLRAQRVESIAVCLLHSYANAEHEQLVGRILERELPDVPITLSSDVAPVIREYERMDTAVANAYVRPIAGEHFEDIEHALRRIGFAKPLVLMQSNGGIITVPTAKKYPIYLLESGPAAGAIGAAFAGRHSGNQKIIAFDMGGTTAKVCLIDGGVPNISNTFEIGRVQRMKAGSGLPVDVPTVEMVEIGAGGGSIASLNTLGLLQVGPRSAGSHPGPAGYGLNGSDPTVTDADIVLGYLDPQYFNGGKMLLNPQLSTKAIDETIGDSFSSDTLKGAAAINKVVDEHMSLAIQVHATENGYDPRDFTLLAYGGAAPLHAARIARKLGISRLLVPTAAGVLSATGLLVSPPMVEVSRTSLLNLHDWDDASVSSMLRQMEQQAVVELAQNAVRYSYNVDMRHVGQGFEIQVDVDSSDGPEEYLKKFANEYKRVYSMKLDSSDAEVVTWRVRAYGAFIVPDRLITTPSTPVGDSALKNRDCWYEQSGMVNTSTYRLLSLAEGVCIEGPAIFQLPETTVVIGPGDKAERDKDGNLVVDIALEGSEE